MNNYIKKLIKYIMIFVMFGMLGSAFLGSDFIAFSNWLSGIGSLAALSIVVYQINMDKKFAYKQARPFFKINLDDEYVKSEEKVSYYVEELKDNFGFSVKKQATYQIISLKNISSKRMMAVQTTVYTNNIDGTHRKFNFKSDVIDDGQEAVFILQGLEYYDLSGKQSSKNKYSVDKLLIYFTTELNESVKIVFEAKGNVLALKNRFLESDGYEISASEYSVDGFVQSKTLKI